MKRREFSEKTLAGAVVVRARGTRSDGGRLNAQGTGSAPAQMVRGEIVIERSIPGRLHQGKVLAAIQPHSIQSGQLTQGPAGESGAMLRARLAARKLRLPILGTDDESANRRYIKQLVLDLFSDELRGIPSGKALGRR
jgi:hypothetical protein